ncbi:glycosyltransferase [Chloroflexota bacterium]
MISLCMVTKDEEMNIRDCVEGVRDIVDEIVVVDTGSTDKTIQIVKTLGSKVIQHELSDDFSMARNLSLRAASTNWILVLDADERIQKDDLPKLKNLAATGKCAGYFLPCHIYLGEGRKLIDYTLSLPCHTYLGEGRKLIDYKLSFFRNMPEIYYEGLVHENVTNSIRRLNSSCEMAEVTIHNYPKTTEEGRNEKERKYEELLKKQISISPNDSRARWFLGWVYYGRGMRQEAAKEFEEAVRWLSRPVEALQASLSLAQIYIEENRLSEAIDLLEKAEGIYFRYQNDVELKINTDLLRAIQGKYQTVLESLCRNKSYGHRSQRFI